MTTSRDLLSKLVNDHVKLHIHADERYAQLAEARSTGTGPGAQHVADASRMALILSMRSGGKRVPQCRRAEPGLDEGPEAGKEVVRAVRAERAERAEGLRIQKECESACDTSRVTQDSIMYILCFLRDPSIDVHVDQARIAREVGSMRDEVVHGLTGDAPLCERFGLKPRSKRLRDLLQVALDPSCDMDDEEAFPTESLDMLLEFAAMRIVGSRLVVIRGGAAHGLPSVFMSSSTGTGEARVAVIVKPQGRGVYRLASGFDPVGMSRAACFYLRVLRADTSRCDLHPDEQGAFAADEPTLIAWAAPMAALGIAEPALVAAIAASSAAKKSRARREVEGRRAALAGALQACLTRLWADDPREDEESQTEEL